MERELFRRLVAALGQLPALPQPRYTYSDQHVVRVLLWAVLHDRPVSWACQATNSGVSSDLSCAQEESVAMTRSLWREGDESRRVAGRPGRGGTPNDCTSGNTTGRPVQFAAVCCSGEPSGTVGDRGVALLSGQRHQATGQPVAGDS